MHIAVESLSKCYGSFDALDDVSLELPPGRIMGLLGVNGAGKTTLLACLTGLLVPDSGTICMDGEVFSRERLDLRRRFGFLPDVPPLLPETTVAEHVGLVLRVYGADREGVEAQVVDLLSDFDLLPLAEARVSKLSRGQAYKAALVALLAVKPEVLFFDEPFASGMDPSGLQAFKRYARSHVDGGGTVVYSTQILEVAERFSDDVCLLHRGRVRACEPMATLRERFQGDSALEGLFAELQDRA